MYVKKSNSKTPLQNKSRNEENLWNPLQNKSRNEELKPYLQFSCLWRKQVQVLQQKTFQIEKSLHHENFPCLIYEVHII